LARNTGANAVPNIVGLVEKLGMKYFLDVFSDLTHLRNRPFRGDSSFE
jgi:hypothetical protein